MNSHSRISLRRQATIEDGIFQSAGSTQIRDESGVGGDQAGDRLKINTAAGRAELTDEELTNIIFNETRSLSGENIDQVRYYLALAILNAQSESTYLMKSFPKMAAQTATVPKVEHATWDAIIGSRLPREVRLSLRL